MADVPPDGWKHTGVKVIPGDQLDDNTPQTPGMHRATAIDRARASPSTCEGRVTPTMGVVPLAMAHAAATSAAVAPTGWPIEPSVAVRSFN